MQYNCKCNYYLHSNNLERFIHCPADTKKHGKTQFVTHDSRILDGGSKIAGFYIKLVGHSLVLSFTVRGDFPKAVTSLGFMPNIWATRCAVRAKSYPCTICVYLSSSFSSGALNTFFTKSLSPKMRSSPLTRRSAYRSSFSTIHLPEFLTIHH